MSDEMNEDRLNSLRNLATPAPSAGARERALQAATVAFDEAQQVPENSNKGTASGSRLSSIFQKFRGNWIMDTRYSLGLGTAAVALLMLPLGYQLYTSTAITVPAFDFRLPGEPVAPETTAAGRLQERALDGTDGEALALSSEADAAGPMQQSTGADEIAAAPAPMASGNFATERSSSLMATSTRDRMIVQKMEPSSDQFTEFDESQVKLAAEEPVSTFSIDVDTASYAYVRRLLNDGYMPSPDAVRIEEMINYFDYGYAVPDDATSPFAPTMQIYPTPWNPNTQLLQIGIKGYLPVVAEDRASNLVFLIDTSGSMEAADKLPLLKRAFGLLVDQLGANDTVSIVTYAGSAGVALEPTRATEKATILSALDALSASGSTAGSAGIERAYELAAQNKVDGGINRVILATDGDFNVGIDDPRELEAFIKARRDQGVFLSVLGFGLGNYGDDTMQALAQSGNGNASYIDSFKEAHKVLVQEIGGTLETIATDVKIQVEFNPAVVAEYRLVGYETRGLNRQDFNNDRVDAGDIGAGHTVTAIYEITLVGSGGALVDPLRYGADRRQVAVGSSDEIGFLRMRYKLPEGTVSSLIEAPITADLAVDTVDAASEDARWAAAVAAFAQKLKGSVYAGTMSYEQIRQLAQGARGADEHGYRAEFMQLIHAAASFDQRQ